MLLVAGGLPTRRHGTFKRCRPQRATGGQIPLGPLFRASARTVTGHRRSHRAWATAGAASAFTFGLSE